jgi:hypothetical protein
MRRSKSKSCFGGALPGWRSMKAPVTGSEKSVESARISAACAAWSPARDALPGRSVLSSVPLSLVRFGSGQRRETVV